MIVGIDEVGRGPWAGPLVVGAVILGNHPIEGLTDSKKLTKKRREELNKEILDVAMAVGLGWVHADELDEIGIAAALVEATKRALLEIKIPYHEIIIDGTVNLLADTGKGPYVTTLKKADLLIPSVSAASIVAKVARDAFMEKQENIYPGYGFASHVGYGTVAHRQAIEELGVTPLHRFSFAPLTKYRSTKSTRSDLARRFNLVDSGTDKTTTKSIGDRAEEEVAKYLKEKGHAILERNWKTRYCEIDIVSGRNGIIYFNEVKHRVRNDAGVGIEAITPRKLQKMNFAARMYINTKKLKDIDLRLTAIATYGDPPVVGQYVEIS